MIHRRSRCAVHAVDSTAGGTGANIRARFITTQMYDQWKVPVFVENKTGVKVPR